MIECTGSKIGKSEILGISFSCEKIGMGPVVELDSSVDLSKLVVDVTKFVSA